MAEFKSVIEKRNISDKVLHKIALTPNEETVYLTVEYMGGRFSVEKKFNNNHIGLIMMEREAEKLDSEEKIRQYLNLDNVGVN